MKLNVNIDVNIYNGDQIIPLLISIKNQLGGIMTVLDEMKQELVEINKATDELASDVDDMITKMGQGAISESDAADLRSQLTSVKEKLTGIAAKHTPESGSGGANEPPFDPVQGQRRNR